MAPPLLTLADIYLTFGGTPLLEGAALTIEERDRLCLVGRNGSGKSTLLKIAADLVEPDDGERFIKPGVTVQYLEQEPDFSSFATVLDYVEEGFHEGEADYRASYLLEQLGLDGTERPTDLSGGETRRAALARVLAPEPDILMLDEPTNHLDVTTIEWLESELKQMSSSIVLISHDRRFLTNLSMRTLWIDRGETKNLNAGFAQFEDWREEQLLQEEQQRHKLDRKIVREEHWLTYGVTARRKRNQKRLGDLYALRAEKKQMKARQTRKFDRENITAWESERSGKLVIEASGISKSYDEKQLVRDLTIKINRRDRIGLVGPNGAGKTTLIRMLTGELEPDSGTVRLGAKLEIVTLDQKRESLDPAATLQDILTGGGGDQVSVGGEQRHVISYMKDFLFLPEQARTPIEALSGGERGRLMLARAFAKPSNLLVLDEPTNDLDLETLDLLQELLGDYSGTVILVSHDRDFLDRVVGSTLVVENGGHWVSYAGGYSDMLEQRRLTAKEGSNSEKPGGQKSDKKRPSNGKEPKSRGKLSYKDKYALEIIPRQMEELEQLMKSLQTKLDDPDLYARDPQTFEKTVKDLEKAQQQHSELEDEWLRLEMLREELEG
jgi:ATP-binding cassette subfamily F protein uup